MNAVMQREHVEVAARHTLSILRWAISRDPLPDRDLREAFDTIYRNSDLKVRDEERRAASKAITFDGVHLGYHHFYGQEPQVWAIRAFLMAAGDNEGWRSRGIAARRTPALFQVVKSPTSGAAAVLRI